MKTKRIVSLLLGLTLVFALLPTTAMAVVYVGTIDIIMSKTGIGKPLPTDAQTKSTAHSQVTKVEWSGDVDAQGNAIYDVAYSVTFTVEIKPDSNAVFKAANSLSVTFNGEPGSVTLDRVSDTMIKVTRKYKAVQDPKAKEEAVVIDPNPIVSTVSLTMPEPSTTSRPNSSDVTVPEKTGTVVTNTSSC